MPIEPQVGRSIDWNQVPISEFEIIISAEGSKNDQASADATDNNQVQTTSSQQSQGGIPVAKTK